ncbi:fimbrial protein [Trinickia mobilis]|uniref:fimbrial protein n=1 Tax=Trinickia mobilis TaxID=2816356 RepID=UPI001A907603|nr:fimbrial protein [Trinickia mobilis]
MNRRYRNLLRILPALALFGLSHAAHADHCEGDGDIHTPIEFGSLYDDGKQVGHVFATKEFKLKVVCNPRWDGSPAPKNIFLSSNDPIPGTDLSRTSLPGVGIRLYADGNVINPGTSVHLAAHRGDGVDISISMKAELVKAGPITPGHITSRAFKVEWRHPGDFIGHEFGAKHFVNTRFDGVACKLAEASKLLNVNLGIVALSDFTGIGTATTPRNFSLHVTCAQFGEGGSTPLSVQFSGEAAPDSSEFIKVTGDAPATGLGVRLSSQDGKTMPVNTWNSLGHPDAGIVAIPLSAQYVQTSGRITPGDANATVSVLIEMR